MTDDAWPSPEELRGPQPWVEGLPIAEQRYEQAVHLAFDSFFRHAAQLDASLRTLETVDVFRRDADALRNDLRALRSLALGVGSPEPAWTTQRYNAPRFQLPAGLFRLAAEAALIVTVAVIAGVAHLRAAVDIALMAAAFVIVSLSEWLAGHNRSVPPAAAFLPAQLERESASPVEAPGRLAWAPAADPTGPEAPTIVDPPAAQAPVRELDASQRGREDAEPAEPDAEPQLAKRSGLFRRRRG